MVFSSLPAYLDPANWQQLQQNHQVGSSGSNPQLLQPPQPQPLPHPPPPPPSHHAGGGTGPGSIRPGSMADRARLANIPMPEASLKCPRCESTNTKFCYFNNYSLSQPRHFCKTCRRYWTRGGALRNVPVGGGCRRNKRSKGSSTSSSKSPATSSDRHAVAGSSSSISVSSDTSAANMLGLVPQIPPALRFMAPLNQLTDYDGSNIGLNYGSISAPMVATGEMNFQIGSSFLGGSIGGNFQTGSSFQQLPFFGGFDQSPPPPVGMFPPVQGGVGPPSAYVGETSHQVRPNLSASMLSQFESVKMEDNNNHELNLSRQFMGAGNDQWSGASWNNTDLSGFTSSSTTSNNPL